MNLLLRGVVDSKSGAMLTRPKVDKLMCSLFWLGLKDEDIIKGTRHLYDHGDFYDKRLAATRKIEFEYKNKGAFLRTVI